MNPTLDITAYYYPQNDTVEVMVRGIDDSGGPIGPQDLDTIQVSLIRSNIIIQQSDKLDKFFLDAEWRVCVNFSHPPVTEGLEVQAIFAWRGGDDIRKRINVVKGQVSAVEADFGDNAVNALDE